METDQEKEGSLRRLTLGEITLASPIFMSTIPYNKVWIHCDSYLPFELQNERTAMTPNGEIYFRVSLYREDFSQSLPDMQHLFIHEMAHIWQREKGMNVIMRGLVSWLVSYRYRFDGRILADYPMEQQAQIIADYFTLEREGYRGWRDLIRSHDVTLDGDISESAIRRQYKHVLKGFPWC
ncbi:type IV secretion protein Rhs [Lelliottia sp. CFBP8978]|jgi:hypothetical protein|uniref:type IV secretion protein Rhs n=1 Tax=Lelliottia sp. CFBP8978 TaxID=3096522 RepID=UPI002A6B2BEF|nr:type IV secretion protein Rhs [Lelliottia sp. CFBP8978]MDY1039326.1 type IV secretion protein Rhs [Lelliottia sp. CFBP8978]